MRALRWSHVVAYDAEREVWLPVDKAGWEHREFAVYVWRADRHGEDTKTERSRRSLKLPARCVSALHELYSAQAGALLDAGGDFPPPPDRLVFPKPDGRMQGPMDVLRAFRKVADRAGLDGSEWTTRELRHTFVSLLSDNEMPIKDIARLVGHSSTRVTETVYRHQLRPVLESGATQMDRIFPGDAS